MHVLQEEAGSSGRGEDAREGSGEDVFSGGGGGGGGGIGQESSEGEGQDQASQGICRGQSERYRGKGRGGRGRGTRGRGLGGGVLGGGVLGGGVLGEGAVGVGVVEGGEWGRGGSAGGVVNEQFTWTDFNSMEHPNAEFLGEAGPSATAKEQEKPLDYLYLLLGVNVFQFIAEETNRYAHQQGNTEFEVSSAEIAALVGVNIAMGIINNYAKNS